jgi:hypothetical protein
MRGLGCALLLVLLAACAANQRTRVGEAAATPFNDLNLVHADVPAPLAEARRDPYAKPADQDCAALDALVKGLDDVLGPDVDIAVKGAPQGTVTGGVSAAGDATFDALSGAAASVIPYRSWIRKLSGAERSSRQVTEAINAGRLRRAYLKGLRAAHDCA